MQENNADAILTLATETWSDQTQVLFTFPLVLPRQVGAFNGDAVKILNEVVAIGWVLRHWSVAGTGEVGSTSLGYPLFGRS